MVLITLDRLKTFWAKVKSYIEGWHDSSKQDTINDLTTIREQASESITRSIVTGEIGEGSSRVNTGNLLSKLGGFTFGIENNRNNITIYSRASDDEEWTQVWTVSDLTGDTKTRFEKGEGKFEGLTLYTSTRGTQLKVYVAQLEGVSSAYIKDVGICLSSKDSTFGGKISYTGESGGNSFSGNDISSYGVWYSFSNMLRDAATEMTIYLNTTYENSQITIYGFRILKPIDYNVFLPGKSWTSYAADKLSTNKTIWGQSFNGSSNVNGSITGATTGTFSSTVTAGSFVKSGGTSSQFLKADGSVDSNDYALSDELALKANSADVTTALSAKANTTDVYTKEETDTKLAGYPTTAEVETMISNAVTTALNTEV